MDLKEMSAWGISQAIAQVIEQGFTYDEETGEITFDSSALDTLEEGLEYKMNSICGYIKDYELKAEGFKQRKKELDSAQKYYENKAEYLKKYVGSTLMNCNKENMTTDDYRISFRKSTSSEIYDEEALRDFINKNDDYKNKYFTYKAPEISKKAIMDDIKATKQDDGTYSLEVPGFKLVENKNVQIK